jgi:hypothetical protein
MVLTDYVIAIPSYHRENTLKKKTMRVLQDYKIDPKKIIIFVADKDQEQIYRNALDKSSYNKLVVGRPGIKNIRNFMPKYFPEGQHILYMDDDINHIYDTINHGDPRDKTDNKQIPLVNLKKLIDNGFNLARKNEIHNWGVYPANNPFFMTAKQKCGNSHIGTKLCYIIGFMTGVINNKNAEIRTIDDKEDYERSIKYYLKDNGLIRFNNITCATRCYKEPGGMQVERTKQRIHDSAVYLTEQYRNLCSLNTSKKSGYTEIRLRDRRPDINIKKIKRRRTKKKRD